MRFWQRLSLGSVLASLLFFTPLVSFAADAGSVPFFGPIIPENLRLCAAGYGMLLIVINNIIALAVTLLITFVAPVLIGWAGFLMVLTPTSYGDRKKAKAILLDVVFGVLIAYSAYLVVSLLMGVLYNGSEMAQKYGKWDQLFKGDGSVCIAQDGVLGTTATSGSASSPPPALAVGPSPTVSGELVDNVAPIYEDTFRRDFAAAGITVNKLRCDPYGASYQVVPGGCTNVGRLRMGTMTQIIAFKKACDQALGRSCVVTITGGSERGHAEGEFSHGRGFKVDLATTGDVNTFINGGGVGQRFERATVDRKGDGAGPTYFDKCNNQYVNEGSHWDITIGGAGQSAEKPSTGAQGTSCYASF